MKKPYPLIKYLLGNTWLDTYTTLEEAMKNTAHSEQYPGHFVCMYNIEKDQVIQFEPAHHDAAAAAQRVIDNLNKKII